MFIKARMEAISGLFRGERTVSQVFHYVVVRASKAPTLNSRFRVPCQYQRLREA